jgi:hypothetical protein
MQKLTATSYNKGSTNEFKPITSIAGESDGGVSGFKFNENNLSNQHWGANANGYEDYNFFYEAWTAEASDGAALGQAYSITRGFTIRIENKCKGKTVSSVSGTPSTQTLYVGSSIALTTAFTVTLSPAGTSADCFYASKIYV